MIQLKSLQLFLILNLMGSVILAKPFTVPLYKDGIKDNPFKPINDEKTVNRQADQNEKGLNRAIYNVTDPDLMVYKVPKSDKPTAAVVVFPGGGFTHVTIDKEGIDVAEWLNGIGITAVIVKYRTVPEDYDRGSEEGLKLRELIVEDAVNAVYVSRKHATEWNLDVEKIGVMGFSAGGYLSGAVITQMYVPDNVDYESAIRPDFACLIYPGVNKQHNSRVDSTLPPVFITVAADDQTTPAPRSISFYEKLYENSIPAELHVFQNGSHGFGLGENRGMVNSWPQLFEKWLVENGILDK